MSTMRKSASHLMNSITGKTWLAIFALALVFHQPGARPVIAQRGALGDLHGNGGWVESNKKGEEAPASPHVVAPGLNGSRRAVRFRLKGYNDAGNTSAHHSFPAVSGERIIVEMTVKPSSDQRTIGIAVRSGKEASAYLRFNGKRKGWVQQYDDNGVYRDIAPFKVNEENRLKIVINTRTRKLKAWVNGKGGDEWNFRSPVAAVDTLNLFMPHGNGPEVFAVVDDISVRDDEGGAVFTENFEGYFRDDAGRVKGASNNAVRVSRNGHWLEFRGKPILPVGDSVTQGWMEGGANFNQRGYLDALAACGINVALLWSYYATSAQAQLADQRIGYDAPEIWPWKGSPDDRSFDLTTFNQAYFDRLRASSSTPMVKTSWTFSPCRTAGSRRNSRITRSTRRWAMGR